MALRCVYTNGIFVCTENLSEMPSDISRMEYPYSGRTRHMQSDLPRQNQSFDAGASTTVTSAFARTKAIAFFIRMLSRTRLRTARHVGLQLLHGQPVLPADGSKLVGIVLVRRSKTFEKSNALGRFLNAQAVSASGFASSRICCSVLPVNWRYASSVKPIGAPTAPLKARPARRYLLSAPARLACSRALQPPDA